MPSCVSAAPWISTHCLFLEHGDFILSDQQVTFLWGWQGKDRSQVFVINLHLTVGPEN